MAAKNKSQDLPVSEIWLRRICWTYIALLIFEGAIRKWVLPGLSDLLLLVRDPFVLAAYAIALADRKFPVNPYLVFGIFVVAVSALTTLVLAHGDLLVLGFGVRSTILHFPFAFIMGRVLSRSDVIEVGRWWLLASLGMAGLIALQFYMPQSAWVNRTVGGGEGVAFTGAMGRYRPPGTFSFIIGVVWFFTFSTAFLITGLTQHRSYPKWLLAVSGMALLIALPVSISRTLMLSAGMTFAVGVFAATYQKGATKRLGRLCVFGVIGLLLASQMEVFDEAWKVFFARWEFSTGEERGGVQSAIIGRLLHGFFGAFTEMKDVPIFGYGLGAGTQAGAKLLTGERGFQLGESEWWRIIGEMGLLVGTAFIFWRVALLWKVFLLSMRTLMRGNGLPIVLLSATAMNLLNGQLGQTTVYGFTIIGLGLTIASMKSDKGESQKLSKPVAKS